MFSNIDKKSFVGLSDLYQGELLLALYRGKELQIFSKAFNTWFKITGETFLAKGIYRIKPKSVNEIVKKAFHHNGFPYNIIFHTVDDNIVHSSVTIEVFDNG
jgi:hypothetical protein